MLCKKVVRAADSSEPDKRPDISGNRRLQLVAGKDLDPHAVEESRRVGRDIRRLVDPVVELVVAEETDVGHEDPDINIVRTG